MPKAKGLFAAICHAQAPLCALSAGQPEEESSGSVEQDEIELKSHHKWDKK